ncbi:MAG: hypothetical protein LBL72_09370 [Candidatus Accumulibacter sp.]|jgi:hypothetical protein|nr:hypothetical protein [Accumulibacter sp.]
MTNRIQICSNALLMLGAQTINDFDEGSDRSKLAANLYPMTVEDVLRAHPWNCAVKRVVLSPDQTAPAFGYAYRFSLPSDWLRTLSVGDAGRETDYRSEGRKLLADVRVLKLRYVFLNDREETWDAALANVVTMAMAWRMAYAITQSASVEQLRFGVYENALKRAKAVDGQDDPPETLGDFPLFASRF